MKVKNILIIILLAGIGFSAMAQTAVTELKEGQILSSLLGDVLRSKNGNYVLSAAGNGGQWCVYPAKDGKIIKTKGLFPAPQFCLAQPNKGEVAMALEADGNLVIYAIKRNGSQLTRNILWASSTVAYADPKFKNTSLKPVKLVVEDSGTIALYAASGEMVWYHRIR